MTETLSNVPIAEDWIIQQSATWRVSYDVGNPNDPSAVDLTGASTSLKITSTVPVDKPGTISGTIVSFELTDVETAALAGDVIKYEIELIRLGGDVDKIAAGSVTLKAELA